MTLPGPLFFVAGGVPILLVALIYLRGLRRRAASHRRADMLRHYAFAAGLAMLFLSLQWPFAEWAHELFYVHQISIIVARIATPILIAMARPAGTLVAGLPQPLRRRVLRPALLAPATRRAWPILSHPAIALLLYVGTFYLWELPALQSAALDNAAIGLAMHLSLLLTGLLFWSRIAGRRPAPLGVSHGERLMMIWLAILAQILLGAYLTVKSNVLYPAYAATERLAMIAPIVDEQRGGFMIWVPSALLSLLAMIVVIDMWGRHETRMDLKRTQWSPSNSAILLYPQTGRALRAMAEPKNKRMAIGLASFALLIFAAVCGVVTGAYRVNRRENLRLYMLSRCADPHC